jgi:hypothetical protein
MKRELQQRINALGPDVEDILEWLVDRLEMGDRQYGKFETAQDKRDFLTEGLEEMIDGIFYIAVRIQQIRREQDDSKTDLHKNA